MIVFHFARLKSSCSSRSIFVRLVANRTVTTRLRDFHTELTFLEQSLKTDSSHSTPTNWEEECTTDELELMALFREEVIGSVCSELSQKPEEYQTEAASLLQHMVRAQGDQCSPALLDLLKFSLSQVQEAANRKSPQVPGWFIPSHELDVGQLGDESENAKATPASARGRWSNSAVMATFHLMQQNQFIGMIERCIRLNHPNVVKVFGASHLRSPIMAVFENVLSTNLREYSKLYEVSLGLKYHFELEIVVDSLQCDDIWIDTDGIAKVNLVRCLTPPENSAATAQNVQWQAPEVVRGFSSPMASNIFSLGMCVFEALTGDVPWGADTNDLVSAKVVRNSRPELPEQVTGAQSDLLKRM